MNLRIAGSMTALSLLIALPAWTQQRDRSDQRQTAPRAFLGVAGDMTDESAEHKGVVIRSVQPNSPAARADLRNGDILLRIDDTRIKEPRDLTDALSYYESGDKVYFQVVRDGEQKTIAVTLGDRAVMSNRNLDSPEPRPSQIDSRARRDDQYRSRDDESRRRSDRSATRPNRGDSSAEQSFRDAPELQPTPFLGVRLHELTDDLKKELNTDADEGVLVWDVVPGSPALQAGLRRGDVITAINHQQVSDPREAKQAIEDAGVDAQVDIEVVRGDQTKRLTATLGQSRADMIVVLPMPGSRQFDERATRYFAPERLTDQSRRFEQLERRIELLEREIRELKRR